ncbi:hypothetical protein PCL_07398 [Purpureocillium lilacinum]|uniref:Uncharacterized protein n=1 Tax=Purpureocillium lilacinum TaxID=33203 RepID=A0A2U3DS82_PURLI|nr:hypothetical protein PCL_07398 [Purpureocillium lilacinum]
MGKRIFKPTFRIGEYSIGSMTPDPRDVPGSDVTRTVLFDAQELAIYKGSLVTVSVTSIKTTNFKIEVTDGCITQHKNEIRSVHGRDSMIQVLLNKPDTFLILEEYKCSDEITDGTRMRISTENEAYEYLSKL